VLVIKDLSSFPFSTSSKISSNLLSYRGFYGKISFFDKVTNYSTGGGGGGGKMGSTTILNANKMYLKTFSSILGITRSNRGQANPKQGLLLH